MVTKTVSESLFKQEQGQQTPKQPLPNFCTRLLTFDPVELTEFLDRDSRRVSKSLSQIGRRCQGEISLARSKIIGNELVFTDLTLSQQTNRINAGLIRIAVNRSQSKRRF